VGTDTAEDMPGPQDWPVWGSDKNRTRRMTMDWEPEVASASRTSHRWEFEGAIVAATKRSARAEFQSKKFFILSLLPEM